MTLNKPKLSVIIPSRGRHEILLRGLAFLARQDSTSFEVVLADDNEPHDTLDQKGLVRYRRSYPLKVVLTGGRGPAYARNRAVERASGERVLFLGDDTWARDRSFLRRHLEQGEENPGKAVLGRVDWDSDLVISDFMRFLAPNGPQFRYDDIADAQDAGYQHFFTSNISLPRRWLGEEMFDEDFSEAAMEDIELGYRLTERGLKIVYDSELVCLHHHHYELPAFAERMVRVGRATALFLEKHPQQYARHIPYPLRWMKYGGRMLSLSLVRALYRRGYWWGVIVDAFLRGYRQVRP